MHSDNKIHMKTSPKLDRLLWSYINAIRKPSVAEPNRIR